MVFFDDLEKTLSYADETNKEMTGVARFNKAVHYKNVFKLLILAMVVFMLFLVIIGCSDVAASNVNNSEMPVSEDLSLEPKLYEGKDNEIVMTIGQNEAYVGGTAVQNDVAPIIVDGRTMLPARFVAEKLGAEVKWDEATRRVDISKDSIVITLYLDSNTAYINNNAIELDTAVFAKDGRTYTPVRFVAENLGAKVDWLEETRQVVIIPDAGEMPKIPASVTVSTAVSYSEKKYFAETDWNYENDIEIPKISGNSAAVQAFNAKIMKKHGDVLDIIKNGKDYGNSYNIGYSYKIFNGVVGIIVLDQRSTIGSFRNSLYYGYYFNANEDRELSYGEYLMLLGVSEDEMIKAINRDSTIRDWDNNIMTFVKKQVSATIYDGTNAIAVVPDDFAAQCLTDFKYEVTADVFEEAEPNPALEAELALIKYVDENSSEFYQDEYYEPHSLFLADINNDRIPELCVEYWSVPYDYRDSYIEAIKYENGNFIKISDVASTGGRGPGIISNYTLYYNDSGKLYFKEETEECNVFSDAQDYVYNVCIYSFDESANREIAKKYTSAIIDGEYYYDEPGTSGTKVTKEYYLSKMEECENLKKTLSVIDIPEMANLAVNITDIWELQKSFYLEK